ncbi:hypothetical protein N7495_005578 [Penicillium taxi]|uniref:uncharacterized protein n=1 Tax=Penicillium taxi TaxID=168475 RepID=UPI002544EE23|nr:uncharacterized protein N7495_005578 [Penicillium taxi]KAJ5893887.1 hypothetical protein N7495_005578 [Penicillium taxi]
MVALDRDHSKRKTEPSSPTLTNTLTHPYNTRMLLYLLQVPLIALLSHGRMWKDVSRSLWLHVCPHRAKRTQELHFTAAY